MKRVIQKANEKALSRTLAVFLAVLMVFSTFSTMLGDLGFLKAWAAGDDGDDTVHSNTAYSNSDYAVIYDKIIVVGCGFNRDISGDLAASLGIATDKVVYYQQDVAGAKAASTAGSLVVYACGTDEVTDDVTKLQADLFAEKLSADIDVFKANGADVLVVTPGPLVEYGAGMYYATHSGWTPEQIASGSNVTNLLLRYVEAISAVATEKNIGILSLYGRATLFGEEEYMSGTTDGIYPSDAGYAFMTRWISEYIAEHYILSSQVINSTTSSGEEIIIDLGAVNNDIDAITVTIPNGGNVPQNITVHTTKVEGDQWFEAVADVKTENHASGVYSASLVFEASQARYVRVVGDTAFPSNTVIKIHKTKLLNPVLTYPVAGQEVTTKQAFNVEWAAVAGADRFEVTIAKKDGTVVKKFTTSEDVQTVPKGIFANGVEYDITVKAIRSGYMDSDAHAGTGSTGVFSASDSAALALSSESINENVSADKLITVGQNTIVSTGRDYTIEGVAGDGKLTDGNLQAEANPENAPHLVNLTALDTDGDGIVTVVLNLGDIPFDVSAVYFDTAYLAAVNTGNAKPDSVKVQYSTDGTNFASADRAMSVVSSVRTLTLGTGTAPMARYIENIGAANVKAVKLTFDLTDAKEQNYLYLDEILVYGKVSGSVNAIARDGQTVLNSGLAGVNYFKGAYESGMWLKHHAFTAVAPLNNAVPVELIINLNVDTANNATSSGNHLVTSLDIGFAVDTNAMCPSSIVVSVQKDGESTWTEVGGKVYINNGTSSTASYVNETIPFTSADASDVTAALVKITLYTNIGNNGYASNITSGTWGNWFALDHIIVNGGQYVGTVEPDGATAAYHANYLQNTDMVGRTNFGDVNNTDIWNTISWKTAGYTTANSGYLESTGNITIGKVYWASQTQGSSTSNKIDEELPTAIAPNVPTTEAKANLSNGKSYSFSKAAYSNVDGNYGAGVFHTGALTDGKTASLSPNQGATAGTGWVPFFGDGNEYTLDIVVDLGAVYTITKASIELIYDIETSSIGTPNKLSVSYSNSQAQSNISYNSTVSILGTVDSSRTVSWTSTNTTKKVATKLHHNSPTNVNARFVKFSVTIPANATAKRIYIDEITITGTEYVPPASGTVVNLAPMGTYAYNTYVAGTGIAANEGNPGAVLGMDYEKPDYANANYNTTTIAGGGTGHRATLNQYAVGKLNDGVEAIYTNGVIPYRHASWHVKGTVQITFDLGGLYALKDISFRSPGREWASAVNTAYKVTYAFSADGSSWSSGVVGSWAADGTLPQSSSNSTQQPVYKNSATAPSGSYRFVRISMENTTASTTTKTQLHIDEIKINGYLGESGEIDTSEKNWALKANGGKYKGGANTSVSTYQPDGAVTDWLAYHDGELNDGIIETATPASATNHVGVVAYNPVKPMVVYKLSAKVDIKTINAYLAKSNAPSDVAFYVGESDDLDKAELVATIPLSKATSQNTNNYKFTAKANCSGSYVFIVPSQTGAVTSYTEVDIIGVKSTKLDTPVITSHYSEQEIGMTTNLDWTDVKAGDGAVVTYSITATNEQGGEVDIVSGLTSSAATFGNVAFTLGEGYYTLNVYASANNWTTSVGSLLVYYSPKYIIRFFATGNGQLKGSGTVSDMIQFAFVEGATWEDEEVKAAIASVTAIPFIDESGKVNYFASWVNADGEGVSIPTTGTITGNADFYASYGYTDNLGIMSNSQMTDGKIFDGRGSREDFTFDFTNNGEAYDYMIIDLGAIYYSLTDFDVSFYKNGNVLPFQITFEVSSKLYVPTIAQGAAFGEEDWQYVSVVPSSKFIESGDGRYSFADDVRIADIIDGVYGRYVKVTFWYEPACQGVDVDEIIISGSDDYIRTDVADGKDAQCDGVDTPILTDGAEMDDIIGEEFTVDLGEVKTSIHSIQIVGAISAATLYISAGGTNADDFYMVETIESDDGTYKLSDKVSARYIRVRLAEQEAVSEIRVYADAGRENFYTDTDISNTIVLSSGTVQLDNVVSKGADVTILANGATINYGGGANGVGTGSVTNSNVTDGIDFGYANGTMLAVSGNNKLWYSLYSSKNGTTNLINFNVVVDWAPTLDSTNVTAVVGSKTYKFEFNGDVKKGFVVLRGDIPYSYSAVREDDCWIINFSVKYSEVTSSNVPSNVSYDITALEGTTAVVSTGARTFETDGDTTGWDYNNTTSTWTTVTATSDNKVIVMLDLGKTYYGLNAFAITLLQSGAYKAPEKVLFQVSDNTVDWKNVGYTQKNNVGDYRYYTQFQRSEAYAYNYSVNFAGTAARYVRAELQVPAGASTAIQEFWVNSQPKFPKASGGDSAVADFDYKMLWDEKNLYLAFQYEEDEVPFYTANHQYYETYTMVYDSKFYTTDGVVAPETSEQGASKPNAFSISNLAFDAGTGYFQLDHTISKLGDAGTETSGYYQGYSTERKKNFKLYKVSNINWNQGGTVTKGEFTYGSATEATTIEKTTLVVSDNAVGKKTLDTSSTLNGYVLVSDGYALSQTIGGYSLTPKPITVDGNTIPADQITDDLVWYFQHTADISGTDENGEEIMTDDAKKLGGYHVFAFLNDVPDSKHLDIYYFDDNTGLAYSPYYLTRAYQGELWENVFTFPRQTGNTDTMIGVLNTDGNRAHTPSDTNWNFDYDAATGKWSIYLRGQGIKSYGNMYDNIDGASSLRIFLSAANMNDTARYDYGNYDIVIDAYVLDRNELILEGGTVLSLDSTLDSKYQNSAHASDYNTAWNGYKNVELKATALGMTPESNDYQVNFNNYKAKAKFTQSENGQRLLTIELAIPFSELGFNIQKDANNKVTKWGNFYTKTGIEKPLGKRTLMQFDSKYSYTSDHNTGSMTDIDEFYYYVDASEFGYIIQFAPEGKGYQDMSYNKGEGYSTFSSVRGEVLNTTNGTEIEYTPSTFSISKIHSTRTAQIHAQTVAALAARDAFTYVEEDGMYYFTSQFDHERPFNQGGTISTELMIPAGGAYFSFDWKVESETSDNLSFWLEKTDTWNSYYKDWIDTYNCGLPYKKFSTETSGSQKTWTGVLDYSDDSLYSLYSEVLAEGKSHWAVNSVELKNDACMAVISGYKDITRNPEDFMLSCIKEKTRSVTTGTVPVNVDNVVGFTPITDEGNGMFKHVWDWHNVTVWIPNTSNEAISYTMTWMYWKNGTSKDSYAATDGRGTDSAQITNFHLSSTDDLGYWKNSENWDTLRLDATIADPSDTMLGVKDLAKAIVKDGSPIPAISATVNSPVIGANNTFGEADFYTLSYAAIAQKETVGTTTKTSGYIQTKNRINVSASNVPASDIESYTNNAIVFTQDYDEIITASSNLVDWTVLELKYNASHNTWELTRMFEEGVDKSKFNMHADNNTIILAVNYTYPEVTTKDYGMTTEAVFFGYQNREVLKMLTPALRYTMSADNTKIKEVVAANENLEVTQLITSNIFIRENYNIANGKMYSLRNNPTYSDVTYPYMENWFRENNTEDALAAFLAVYSETPLYYVNENGEVEGMDNTDGDYSKAFQYFYKSYVDNSTALGLTTKPMRFDTNQYGNVLYVPAGVGQLTDGKKMSVYSDTYLIQTLEEYAIGYFVTDTMGTPDADTVEAINPDDRVYSYTQPIDLKHDMYEVFEDVHTREENIILDLGTVEYGLSAFNVRFLGGGEDGVTFPTSVEFSISSDGLSYAYIGSVALDDTSYDVKVFDDEYAHASIVFSGATDTVYGNTVADYMFDLQSVGVTARYIKATIMNHSAQNAKTFITEFQVIQNAIYPDEVPVTTASTWVDASADANLMYLDNLERWDNSLNKPYSFALAPTTAGYLFAEDEGYPDIAGHNTAGAYVAGQLTDGVAGSALYKVAEGQVAAPSILEIKEQSVGWMKAYAPEVSLVFDLGEAKNVGFVSVYALQSKDSVDKITQPYNVTAYVPDYEDGGWLKVATVNAKDNDASEVTLKGMDVVIDTDTYTIFKYTLAFARDGELAQQVSEKRYVKVVAETDGGEDGWICLTEVEVFEGHPCYPVYDLTDSKYEKTALGLTDEQISNQNGEVRPTFFRGYYDSDLYADELPPYTAGATGGVYIAKNVFNDVPAEDYTIGYVFGNVEQRALDGRGVPYFYEGDQLLFRVTTDQLNCEGYDYRDDWVSTYKLLAESRIYYTSVGADSSFTTRLFTTTAVPTPMTRTNVLARDRFTCELPEGYNWENSYYYLPIYLMNTLDYLKDYGYLGNKNTQNYINMPSNKVELTGDLVWDTNSESDYDVYADDMDGISLNLAPLGAKTNTDTVKYNGIDRAANTTLRFGSIWYIDDTAYYNTHTHMKDYGTLLMTIGNLGKYFTDGFASTSKYVSVFDDYALKLTKLDTISEVTGVTEVTGIDEVIKLSDVTEVLKLTNVVETNAENAKFVITSSGETKYYTCDEDIDTNAETGKGHVWKNGENYWYCADKKIGKYKFTTGEDDNVKYWYCKEDVSRVNYVNEAGYWYSSNASIVDNTNVFSAVLANGEIVYYYSDAAKSFKAITHDSTGRALYWTYDQDVPSWTFSAVVDGVTKYYYSDSFDGVAGGYVLKDGEYYASPSNALYSDVYAKDNEYWGAKSMHAFEMLKAVDETVGSETTNEAKVMAAMDIFLEFVNKYDEGEHGYNASYEDFGGIALHSKANKYYYFSNISTKLVPEDYTDADKADNPLYGTDSNKDKQNQTDLLGVYNYDHRYLEFDAIIAGIPASQKNNKIVAVPYVIYANNYEFLEFGEHLGEGDEYVSETWFEIFNRYYGGDLSENNRRRYVYGGGVARSINDVLASQEKEEQYD